MTTLKVRFDGRVLVPETPVDLPQDRVLEVSVADSQVTPTNGASASPFAGLQEILAALPDDPNTPTDLAAQHDHYLHGMPKRP